MDKALKQRLVGASVLIALAVVVLPMLFSGQAGNPQESRSIEVPPRPAELSFETRRFPLGDSPAGRAPHSVPANEPKDMEPDQGTVEPGIPVEAAEKPSERAAPEPAKMAEEAPGEEMPGRYLVQVASFSTTANANRLADRLRDDGMSVMMDSIVAEVGTLHRVRVGPFGLIEEANDALAQIRARTPDVNPRVIDLRPDESAPVTDPSDPLVRWVVQVGSFSARENADKLVSRLRASGFSAFNVSVRDAGGTRHKVRVGPEIERQAAVRIAERIREKMSLEGIVMVSE
jgi:DedD protein